MKNNAVFKKITIANHLKQFEVKEVFALGGLDLSSSTIKGFAASSRNKNRIEMSDEQLEAFFNGLILYWRGDKEDSHLIPRGFENFIMNLMKDGNLGMLDELSALIEDAKAGIVSGCDEDEA